MQSPNYIEPKDILAATNGGLDIIFDLYPQAIGCETDRKKKFKLREEKSASANLYRNREDGVWLVTDFGGDQRPRNAIGCYMIEKGLTHVEAIRELAARYNIVPPEQAMQQIRAEFSEQPAAADQEEGQWTWKVRNSFTDEDIETIVSKNILNYLGWVSPGKRDFKSVVNTDGTLQLSTDENRHQVAYTRLATTFKLYRWHSLESYSFVKDRRFLTFSATPQYPIFLIDEGTHQKIYQPKHPDKSRRFMYAGKKPKDFIHGLEQLQKAFNKRKEEIEIKKNEAAEKALAMDEDPEAAKAKVSEKPVREPEIILCTGGSDAINVALLGYKVIWLNSETAKLQHYQYDKLAIMTEKIYQLPDIDLTGKRAAHELALEYLDIYTIELPEELKKYKDARGHFCKDVRDYFNYYKYKDFKQLVAASLPYRFWEKKARFEGRGEGRMFVGYDYDFDNVQAYNFLAKNGFFRLSAGDKKTDWLYIRKDGNVVREQHPNDVKGYIHTFLREKMHDKNLRNAMYRTTQLNDTSLSNLDLADIDFSDCSKDSQYLFFTNRAVEVTRTGIKYHKPGVIDRFIWEDDVHPHWLEEHKEAPFTITRDELGIYDIEIHNFDCNFLKFLVQTSRMHWRTEFEGERMDAIPPAERDQYLVDNHCTIAGKNLTEEEIEEQKAHLINKIFAIGYLLHRYRDPTKGWFVWGMDGKNNEDGLSHGGSGKSLVFDKAMRLMLRKNFYLNGRLPKLAEDAHKYDGLSEHHRYALVEDAHEFMNLGSFFTDINGDVKVNPKGKQPYSIPFEKAPKFAFTSNFPPRNLDSSTERRMVYFVVSDWYHNKGQTNDYKETRDPKTDLGLTLFNDFDKKQWNDFYVTMMHCLQFYLTTDEKLEPAMDKVNKRNLYAEMGNNFHDWALAYFSDQGGKLDRYFVREEAFGDYKAGNRDKTTPQLFLKKLRAFCRFYGFGLNPKVYQDKNGKIIQKVEQKMYQQQTNTWELVPNAPKVAKELFFIQTRDFLPDDPFLGFQEGELARGKQMTIDHNAPDATF